MTEAESPAYLVDSSVWAEWLRDRPGRVTAGFAELIERDLTLATTEPVQMELLAGATDERALGQINALLAGLTLLTVSPGDDFHQAAALCRGIRARGRTVRKLIDCLTAAVALRHKAVLVHADADFEAIADTYGAPWVSLR